METWRGLLRRHPAQGQQILRKLIDGRLLLRAQTDQPSAYYEFEGTGTLTGLLAGIAPHKLASPSARVTSRNPMCAVGLDFDGAVRLAA